MAARILRSSIRVFLLLRLITATGLRQSSTAAAPSPGEAAATKIVPIPKKKVNFTGAMIGLAIAGVAYMSTADEVTFCGWLFSATKFLNPLFVLLDTEFAHCLAVSAAEHAWFLERKDPTQQYWDWKYGAENSQIL